MSECPLTLRVRSLVKEDLPKVLALEQRQKGCDVWDEAEIVRFLGYRKRARMGLVALLPGGKLTAYALLAKRASDVRVWRLAGIPDAEGKRALRVLVDRIKSLGKDTVCVCVRESELEEQLFWKGVGFKCCTILKGERGFDCPPEPAYYFLWRKNGE